MFTDTNLGQLRSVHRPIFWRILFLTVLCLCLLIILLLIAVIMVNELRQVRGIPFAPIGGLIVIGLLFALLVSFLVGELRKWLPTRKAALRIYERGFSYQKAHRSIRTCRWDEVKDVTHRRVMIHRKHGTPMRVLVIRSIVLKDGEIVEFADTLQKVTRLIGAALKTN